MKVYCILLDAFPLKQELIDFANKYNFKLSKQFTSGIYTIPTMFSMLHGEPPNKIIENGISYNGPEKDNNNFFKFYKQNNNNLIHILNNSKYDVFIDNFYAYLKIPIGWKYDENMKNLKLSNIKKDKNIIYQDILYPTNYKNVKLLTTRYNPAYIWPYQNYDNDIQTQNFYDEILNNINFVQEKQNDTFYILTIQDYHHISRILKKNNIDQKILINKIIKRIINLLSKINFNEPNSLFYIFADHGLGGNELFDLENYYTWALIKDNTINTSNIIQKPFISSCDFYQFILNKICIDKLDYKIVNKESQDIYSTFDKNRIYYIEDSRMYSSPIACNTLATVKIIKYNENIPLEILQLTYKRGICDTTKMYYIFIYKLRNNLNYLFDYNYTKEQLFLGNKEEVLVYMDDETNYYLNNIKELYESLINNNPCLIDDSIIEANDLDKINKIRIEIKQKYILPKQYTINIDNKTVYRYETRDNDDYYSKHLSKLIQYNNIISKYIKLF